MRALMKARSQPQAIHNNCSGKHAGMLAAAVQLGLIRLAHQRPRSAANHDRRNHSETCGVRLDRAFMGVDGCSVPTWSLPSARWRRALRGSAAGRGWRWCERQPRHD